MFKPFNYFVMEKLNGTALESTGKDKIPQLKQEFAKIDDATLTRFVKTTELSFDLYSETNKNTKPYHTFLNFHELTLLFKSYGFTPKPHPIARVFYRNKHSLSEKDMADLDEKAKRTMNAEHEEALKTFMVTYFKFSRALPEKRVVDYLSYSSWNKAKNNHMTGDHDEIKAFKDKFIPAFLYLEKQSATFNDLTYNERRMKIHEFNSLEDEEKKIWVKKCEEVFDKHKFKKHDNGKPVLSYILNNNEVRLLFESYNYPQKPPLNLPGHYMRKYWQKHFKSTSTSKETMKQLFAEYKKLSESEKAALNIELQVEKESYSERFDEFLKNLPNQREADLEILKSKEKKSKSERFEMKPQENGNESEGETQPESPNTKEEPKPSVFDEQDFSFINELDARIENAKNSTKLEEFLAENSSYSENSFSCYVTADLKSQKKMNDEESLTYLKKITHKWIKLDDDTKSEYENNYKKQKKELKKNIKKFLQENENLNLEADDMKNKKKDMVRTINIKLDEENELSLVIGEKNQAALIAPSVSEVDVMKHKKPKSVEGTSAKKRKISEGENGKSPKKKVSVSDGF